ncbi:MAG: ABC transporter permease [Desulfobacterales bacterium]|nr:ABC transporter permease [Desulfobacterales bacterium]
MSHLNLILELTKRDFSERFAGSVLGSLWAFIWPIVQLLIYIVIFGQIMGSRLPGSSNIYSYSIYVSAGLITWTAFANTISRCTSIFLDKKHIISKINLSLPDLLLYIILSESITFLITIGFFFVFLLITEYPLDQQLILFPFIYYLQQLFAFGFGLLAASLTVFLRDLKEIVGIILQFWFWFTPIVYVRDILPESVKKILVYNPACIIIEAYQDIFVFHRIPDMNALMILSILTHLLICFSYYVFQKLEKDIRDFI